MQKQPGTRFNAYDDLFSIRKRDEEDLQSLINHVDDAVHRIRDLQSIGFTLDKITVQNVFVREDNQRRRRQDESPAVGSALVASPSSSTICGFCGYSGHTQDACRQYANAKEQFLKNRNTRGRIRPNKNNNNSHPQDAASVSQVTKFAGNASALSNWLADTGATSHMTPHRYWVQNYSIRLEWGLWFSTQSLVERLLSL